MTEGDPRWSEVIRSPSYQSGGVNNPGYFLEIGDKRLSDTSLLNWAV